MAETIVVGTVHYRHISLQKAFSIYYGAGGKRLVMTKVIQFGVFASFVTLCEAFFCKKYFESVVVEIV